MSFYQNFELGLIFLSYTLLYALIYFQLNGRLFHYLFFLHIYLLVNDGSIYYPIDNSSLFLRKHKKHKHAHVTADSDSDEFQNIAIVRNEKKSIPLKNDAKFANEVVDIDESSSDSPVTNIVDDSDSNIDVTILEEEMNLEDLMRQKVSCVIFYAYVCISWIFVLCRIILI